MTFYAISVAAIVAQTHGMVKTSMQRANRVMILRKQMGWSQAQLGAKIDVAKETISKIERRVQGITEGQAHAMATVFGVRIDDLYEAGTEYAPGLAEEAAPFVPNASSFESRIPLEENQSWYRISKSYLDQLGFMDGDQIIIDVSRGAMENLHIGDIVVANQYRTKGQKSAETIVRQFIPPSILITNSLHKNQPILNTRADDVVILGIVVHPRRRS
jgi:transcriptional regulator with XRE-family HTH domain